MSTDGWFHAAATRSSETAAATTLQFSRNIVRVRFISRLYFGTAGAHTATVAAMCRNITTLRGLEPSATNAEIEAAARQYIRKVTGVQKTSAATEDAFDRAVAIVAEATERALAELPPRKVPPKTEPPLRRLQKTAD